MKDWRIRLTAVALLSVLVGAACDDNPVDEGIDEPARLTVNPTFTIVDAADTTTVDGVVLNEFGAPTLDPVSFAACDSKIAVTPDPRRVAIEPPERALVVGQELGESCVEISSGGLSATTDVNVVPAGVGVTAASTTLESGSATPTSLVLTDAADNEITGFGVEQFTFSVDDAAVAEVADDGTLSPKAPGSAEVTATLKPVWGAERSGSFAFEVVPGPFGGSFDPSSVTGAEIVSITPGSGLEFDDDTGITVGGVVPFVLSTGAQDMTIRAPWGVPAGANEVLFTRIGEDQIAQIGSLDYTADATDDAHEPNDLRGGEPPAVVSFPFETYGAVAGDDLDDFYQISFSEETTIHMLLEWVTAVNGDLDLLVTDAAFTAFQCGFATASADVPEEGTCTLGPGDYFFWLNNFEAEDGGSQAITNYHLVLEEL